MSGIIRHLIKEKVVYWAPSGVDDYGNPAFSTPVEIDARWEDTVEQFVDIEGDQQMSRAKVYCLTDLEVQGILLLGSLTTSVDQVNPRSNDGAWEIRRVDKQPNIRATEFLRTAWL